MPQLLTETFEMTPEITEAADGKMKFRGKFGIVGEATKNGRLYRSNLMERELDRIAPEMKGRGVFGELDHPDDGRTRLTRVSHIVTEAKVEDGEIVGAFEVLSTPNGRILESLGRDRVKIGVSLRGFGSTESKEVGGKRIDEVKDDFRLETFDVVYKPAADAYPQLVAEAHEAIARAEENMDLSTLKKDYPGIIEEIVRELRAGEAVNGTLLEAEPIDESAIREEIREAVEAEARAAAVSDVTSDLTSKFEDRLRSVVETLSVKAMARARSEALSDPDVAGAKSAMAEIGRIAMPFVVGSDVTEEIRKRDAKIDACAAEVREATAALAESRKMADRYESLAYETALTLRVERACRGADGETRRRVVEAVGDVTRFESLEALDEVLTGLTESVIEPATEDARIAEEARIGVLEAQIGSLREQIDELESEQLDRVVETNDQMAEANDRIEQLEADLTEARDKVTRIAGQAEEAAVQAFSVGVSRSHPRAEQLRVAVGTAKTLREALEIASAFDGNTHQGRDLSEDEARAIQKENAHGVGRDPSADEAGIKRIPLDTPLGLDADVINRVAG